MVIIGIIIKNITIDFTARVAKIPVAWLIALLPHAYGTSQYKPFDKRSPRTFLSILEKDQTIDKAVSRIMPLTSCQFHLSISPFFRNMKTNTSFQFKARRLIRCEAAHANNLESLEFFATAVLAGNFAGLPVQTLNALSVGYILSRIVYNFVYINCTTVEIPRMRSLLWVTGLAQIIMLYFMSGNVLKDRPAFTV
jgi:uncharacterized MAPEG superfamily protein